VEAIEHAFNQDKEAVYAIERTVVVAAPGRALWGMLEYSTPELVDE
jgi:hypothetical protein